ncbi:MAG: hypothetical protein Q9187_009355, partial [Circinaria calcarea]
FRLDVEFLGSHLREAQLLWSLDAVYQASEWVQPFPPEVQELLSNQQPWEQHQSQQ